MPTDRPWPDDEALFAAVRGSLFPAVVGDVMDAMGLVHQFLPPEIQPLGPDMVVLGRAMTVLERDFASEDERRAAMQAGRSPGVMLEALDNLRKNEVYLCTGASPAYAVWGELMSTRARQLGAAGAVLNGYSRDTRGILKLGFPTFSIGRYAQDQRPRGEVVAYRTRITIGETDVSPGDIVFGDLDGVLVIPQHIENEVLRTAMERARREDLVRTAFERDHMSASGAAAKYGVM
jgi:regulator of RNase E activity RraA